MSYKVVVPCAGTGSRLHDATKYVPKALVSIGTKPAISRIIEKFPKDCKFIIPVGYKGELIKEYLTLAYPDLDITFVDILLYEGEGSGLGLSLSKCKKYLQEPFVFCSCDTLIGGDNIDLSPVKNYMGWDNRNIIEQYRTITINKANLVRDVNDKGFNSNIINDDELKPYIGLAGIHDYDAFWSYMDETDINCIRDGESHGLKLMAQNGFPIYAEQFNWYDVGIQVELENTREKFENESIANVLPKEDEAIWLLEDKAIKFHQDPKFISNRITRGKELSEFIPAIIGHTTHMYSSELVRGSVLSQTINIPQFKKFLDFSEKFWIRKDLEDDKEFKKACKDFYIDKTLARVNDFYKKYNHNDDMLVINGVPYSSFSDIWMRVDQDWLLDGIPSQYHGDYHFENVMWDDLHDKFKLLDWRQGFGSLLNTGDIYYDLAKLLHGLIISHELIHLNLYEIEWDKNIVTFDFNRKQKLIECENYYYEWLNKKGYDVKKVKVLTALIFLNIASLHHYNYCELLYILGLTMLANTIAEDEI